VRYALDTNILVYFFKGMGNVARRLLSVPPADIGIPAIVLFEIEFGIAKSTAPRKRRAQLREFASLVATIPFGHNEARTAATIRAGLEKSGRPIGPYDLLIAASALANNAVLVTHNQRELSRIPDLKLEDWY
jgi:tRNA(fMet)-specific endonuclease VapC